MVPKNLSERLRQLAAKCLLLGVDFETTPESQSDSPSLIIKVGGCSMEVAWNGKVTYVGLNGDTLGEWIEKDKTFRLTARGLKVLWDALALFADTVAADKEAAEKVLRLAAVHMLQEGETVLDMNQVEQSRRRLLARFSGSPDGKGRARPKRANKGRRTSPPVSLQASHTTSSEEKAQASGPSV